MKVIEELVDYLQGQGLLRNSDIDWLRAQGLIPSPYQSYNFEPEEEDDQTREKIERYLYFWLPDHLDEWAEEQTQKTHRRKLRAWKYAKSRASQKHKMGGPAETSQPIPRRGHAHYQQRAVVSHIKTSDTQSRRDAIKNLVHCLRSVDVSFHQVLMATLVAIASQSADAFIDLLLELFEAKLLEEKYSHTMARGVFERSVPKEDELIYNLAARINTFDGNVFGNTILLEWLYHKILTHSQRELILHLNRQADIQKGYNLQRQLKSLWVYLGLEHFEAHRDGVTLVIADEPETIYNPEKLFSYSNHPVSVVRELAREILTKADFPVVEQVEELIPFLGDKNPHVVKYAFFNLRSLRDNTCLGVLSPAKDSNFKP